MKAAVIDTNIISAFMRGNPQVIRKIQDYLEKHDTLTISIITYYEILRGIKALSNENKIKAFHEFMQHSALQAYSGFEGRKLVKSVKINTAARQTVAPDQRHNFSFIEGDIRDLEACRSACQVKRSKFNVQR